jgi:hypothetical protein
MDSPHSFDRESELLIGFWVRTYGSARGVASEFRRNWVGEALPGVGAPRGGAKCGMERVVRRLCGGRVWFFLSR